MTRCATLRGDRRGPGVRVPPIIISPYVKRRFVDHTTYETVSILKFIESRWKVAPPGGRDAAANNLLNAFDSLRVLEDRVASLIGEIKRMTGRGCESNPPTRRNMLTVPALDELNLVMDRRRLLVVLGAGALTAPLACLAQLQSKVWRIGMLETVSQELNAANLDAFQQGLRELGYIEGRNLIIEYRSADGRSERFPGLVTELIGLKVDLMVTRGTPASLAAKRATQTIPVVMANAGEPVESGLVSTLARPGGNVTGLSSLTVRIEAKRLALLREMVPNIERVAALYNMNSPANPPQWKEVETAARSLGVQSQLLDVRKPEDFGPAFDAATRQRADGIIVGQEGLLQANRKLIAELAAKHRLPAIYRSMEFIEAGGLMAYGPSYPDLYRRAASYVDKIFKGANPGDLPVEQPTKFELIINLKTAKALGLTTPPALLLRADEVIK